MDLFETDEERGERTRRTLMVGVIIIVVVALIGVGIQQWWAHKPLPQVTECKMIGFSAGEKVNGITICYKNCATNRIASCRTRRLIQ